MDFSQAMRTLARRWYVAVLAIAVVFGIAYLATLTTDRGYESTGTVVLTEPDPGAASNPLLLFDGSLNTAAELLIQSLNSPATARQLGEQGASPTYTATDGTLKGPYVVVTADATTSAQARRTVSLALAYVRRELVSRQQALGAPTSQYIVVEQIVAPTPPALQHGGRSRLAAVTLLLAVVTALTAVFGVETYSARRRRLRASG